MQPFNIAVEAPAADLDAQLHAAVEAVLPTDGDTGGSAALAAGLADDVAALCANGALGSNVDTYAVNIAGHSVDGRTDADAELAELSVQIRALTRTGNTGISEPAGQV